jgi:hypothetical protein
MGSNDLGSVKVDGFPNGEGDMSKKKRHVTLQPGEQIELDSSVKIEPVEAVTISESIYRQFTPRPCTLCETLRPANTNASYVYCTRGKIRFCKCKECGHTWSQEWN